MKVLYFFVALILAGTGIARIVIPEEMIYMRYHRWFQDPEPTEHHIARERIGGIASIVMAIILLVMLFIL